MEDTKPRGHLARIPGDSGCLSLLVQPQIAFEARVMKQPLCSVVILLALTSAGRAEDAKLTADAAKKLLPEAAGISNADMEALSKDRTAGVPSKSLSLVLMSLKPPTEKIAEASKEFSVVGVGPVSEIVDAM